MHLNPTPDSEPREVDSQKECYEPETLESPNQGLGFRVEGLGF